MRRVPAVVVTVISQRITRSSTGPIDAVACRDQSLEAILRYGSVTLGHAVRRSVLTTAIQVKEELQRRLYEITRLAVHIGHES